MDLKGFQRSFLLKKAHKLKPLVMIGRNGLSDSLIAAVNEALDNHELIKIKFQDFKKEKKEISAKISKKTKSIFVKIIGNLLVLYKPKKDVDERAFHLPGNYGKAADG